MSTRARIAFIVREEGYRLEYSKHWDGYPHGVLGSLPTGIFTIEELIKQWGLTETLEGFTEYYYEFDFRKMTLKIWGADISEIPWKQGELTFDGTIEEAYKNTIMTLQLRFRVNKGNNLKYRTRLEMPYYLRIVNDITNEKLTYFEI